MFSLVLVKDGKRLQTCVMPSLNAIENEAFEARKAGYLTEIGVI
jgi:hypothetical protein